MTSFARSTIRRAGFGSPAADSSQRLPASTSHDRHRRATRPKSGTACSRKRDSPVARLRRRRFVAAAKPSSPKRDHVEPGDSPRSDLVGRFRGTPRIGARVSTSCARPPKRRGQPESPRHRCGLRPHQQYGAGACAGKHPPAEAIDGALAGFRRQRLPVPAVDRSDLEDLVSTLPRALMDGSTRDSGGSSTSSETMSVPGRRLRQRRSVGSGDGVRALQGMLAA